MFFLIESIFPECDGQYEQHQVKNSPLRSSQRLLPIPTSYGFLQTIIRTKKNFHD